MFQQTIILLFINIIIALAQKDGDIKTIGENSIIEIYYNGEWLPLCYQDIDDTIRDIICRDLGFDRALKFQFNFQNCQDSTYITENGKEAEMVGNFGLDFSQTKFTCNQSDESLLDCVNRIDLEWRDSSSFCDFDSCVKIDCEFIPQDELPDEERYGLPEGDHKEGDISIEDNNMLYYFNGEFWDPVCDFLFSSIEADIICDELGYYESKEKSIDCDFVDKKGYRQHQFKYIDCIGDNELSECDITSTNCFLSNCVSLTCSEKKIEEVLEDTDSMLAYLLSGGGILLIIIIILIIYKCRSDKNKKKQAEKQQKVQLEQQQKYLQTPNVYQPNNQIIGPNAQPYNPTMDPNAQPYNPTIGPNAQPYNPTIDPNVKPYPTMDPNSQPYNPTMDPNVQPYNSTIDPNAQPNYTVIYSNAQPYQSTINSTSQQNQPGINSTNQHNNLPINNTPQSNNQAINATDQPIQQ